MRAIILIQIINIIVTYIVNGFTFMFMGELIATIMYCMKKFGLIFKMKTIFTVECIFTTIYFIYKCIFKSLQIKTFIIIFIIRCIFYAVIKYDETKYVLVSRRIKK